MIQNHLIGVISDTHNLLRPQAIQGLQGCDLIIHAGDVGKAGILDQLAAIAPVVAVRGNVDNDSWAQVLPLSRTVEVGGCRVYALHKLADLDIKPAALGMAAVIYGHSHEPSISSREGVLYLNPGSAGPKRFHLTVSMALMKLVAGKVTAELVSLNV